MIYTFWAKHGPCQAKGVRPSDPYSQNACDCREETDHLLHSHNMPESAVTRSTSSLAGPVWRLGQKGLVLDNEPAFTELSQPFATRLKQYSQGSGTEKKERPLELLDLVAEEEGLKCPHCRAFAGHKIKAVLDRHAMKTRISDLKKKDFGIESRHAYMYLLIHPKWLEGAPGFDNEEELGGYAGAAVDVTSAWYTRRLSGLRLIEVRGRILLVDEEIVEPDDDETSESEEPSDTGDEEDRKKWGLPREIRLADGTLIDTRRGTVPVKAHFTCGSCGLGGKDRHSEKNNNVLEAVRQTGHTAPVAAYALQCHCPQCEAEGYIYGGRYFKAPDVYDIERLDSAEREWAARSGADLTEFWPRAELWVSYMTHKLNGGIANWGYTHWWKMFNPRQLLVHAQLLRAITEAPEDTWSLDVREQVLGAFQQYLRNQNMFSFWNQTADKMEPMMSNANYHPKMQGIGNCVFNSLGRGNWNLRQPSA